MSTVRRPVNMCLSLRVQYFKPFKETSETRIRLLPPTEGMSAGQELRPSQSRIGIFECRHQKWPESYGTILSRSHGMLIQQSRGSVQCRKNLISAPSNGIAAAIECVVTCYRHHSVAKPWRKQGTIVWPELQDSRELQNAS